MGFLLSIRLALPPTEGIGRNVIHARRLPRSGMLVKVQAKEEARFHLPSAYWCLDCESLACLSTILHCLGSLPNGLELSHPARTLACFSGSPYQNQCYQIAPSAGSAPANCRRRIGIHLYFLIKSYYSYRPKNPNNYPDGA